MRGHKRELVHLYFDGVVHKLPPELWWLCLEISGLVRVCGKMHCLVEHSHPPICFFETSR